MQEVQVCVRLSSFPDAGHSQNGTAESRFEASIAVYRHGDDPPFAGFAVDVMTAVDPA